MFHPKKPSTMCSDDQRSSMCVHGNSGLVLTTDPKPRLRWTLDLHTHFVEAVTQLGGPHKATPKTIMRVMGVKGLTLFHLKSHLQKFRLGKLPHKEFIDHSIKHELQRNTQSKSNVVDRDTNDNSHMVDIIKMQMEEQKKLHEQLEVQRHLQLRIEAQGKYTQSILEKACETLVSESVGWEDHPLSQQFHVCNTLTFGEETGFEEQMDGFLPIDDDIAARIEMVERANFSGQKVSNFMC